MKGKTHSLELIERTEREQQTPATLAAMHTRTDRSATTLAVRGGARIQVTGFFATGTASSETKETQPRGWQCEVVVRRDRKKNRERKRACNAVSNGHQSKSKKKKKGFYFSNVSNRSPSAGLSVRVFSTHPRETPTTQTQTTENKKQRATHTPATNSPAWRLTSSPQSSRAAGAGCPRDRTR